MLFNQFAEGRFSAIAASFNSLFDAGVRNRWVNVLMRVRIIFISPPQHLQRIVGRGFSGGITTCLNSCTN